MKESVKSLFPETSVLSSQVRYSGGITESKSFTVVFSEAALILILYPSFKIEKIPVNFKGSLRDYQKAGYNWFSFLREYNFGGCLADDMGLGKTVQTLCLLQSLKEQGETLPTLLVMPTSLLYNWEMEAKKFTPQLRVLVYSGPQREKLQAQIGKIDLILCSFGMVRSDIEWFEKQAFSYVILDESQAIKNPLANITKAVQKLNAKFRLVMTGTPLENSTMDLWSQMNFVNAGLLGSQRYFKDHFQLPIEKKADMEKKKRLYFLIKPYLLRREKRQVAADLPEKMESVTYCSMTEEQERLYDKTKSFSRDVLLKQIKEIKCQNIIRNKKFIKDYRKFWMKRL